MPTVFDQPADGDVATVSQLNQYASAVNALESGAAYWGGSSAGTTTAYTASLTPAASNTAGQVANLVINATNTGASTLALNGQTALPIRKNGAALVAGDLQANAAYTFICDGTYWHVVGGGGSAGSTNASTAFSSGQVPLARGGTGADLSATGGAGQFLKQSTAGGTITVGTIAAGDLPNHGTNLLTSGQLALARGGTGADLSATGGTGQVLKQSSAGGVITVGTLAHTDVGAAAASHTHGASDISSGTLPVARGGTGLGSLGTAGQVLKVNPGATALEYGTAAGLTLVCVLRLGANHAALTNSVDTAILWDTEEIDPLGLHSTSSDTNRLTIPSGQNGDYFAIADIAYEFLGPYNVTPCFRKNGTKLTDGGKTDYWSNESAYYTRSLKSIGFFPSLVAGDYFDLVVLAGVSNCVPQAGGRLYIFKQ